MAVSKVPDDARDDPYEVRLYNPMGGRYKKVVRGKRAAERHELEVRAVLAGGGMAAGPQRTVTVEELMEQILAARPNLDRTPCAPTATACGCTCTPRSASSRSAG